MLKEVKEFFVTPIGNKPSLDDCIDAINLAIKYDCFIKMRWYVPYSGKYEKIVNANDNEQEIYDSLPKVYGV